jgi:ribosomal protein S18 acetylase RimI-like enzyme
MEDDKPSLACYAHYREAQMVDLPGIEEFDHLFSEAPKTRRWWASKLDVEDERNRYIVVVAVHGATNNIVGVVVAAVLNRPVIRIARILIHPEVRRNRIGTRILLPIYATGNLHGIQEYEADVPEDYTEMQLFFRSLGFMAELPIKQGKYPELENGNSITFRWSPPDEVR